MKSVIRCLVLLMPLAGAVSLPAWAAEHGYPSKPIRFVVPFTPGGSQDVIARIFAAKLADTLGQQVVVDNRGGAAGLIAAEMVAKAPRDGYTMLLATGGQISLAPALHPRLAYDPVRDFASVGQIADQAMSLVTNNAVPAKAVAELVAYAKGKSLNYASTGNGTISHLTMEAFKQATGINATHVPYKGAGPAFVDLIAGQVQLMFTGVPSAQPFVSTGKARMLAVASRKRSALFPDVPTLIESGLKDFVSTVWIGVVVPSGTPDAIVKRLNAAFMNALKQTDLLDRLAAVGAEPAGSTPAEFEAAIKADIARWAKVVKATGIKIE